MFMTGLSALETCPLVQRAGLTGDHLRVVGNDHVDPAMLKQALEGNGTQVQAIQLGEASLDDVFIHLRRKSKRNKNYCFSFALHAGHHATPAAEWQR